MQNVKVNLFFMLPRGILYSIKFVSKKVFQLIMLFKSKGYEAKKLQGPKSNP